MQTAIGVRFKKAGKINYYRPGFTNLSRGDWVIAETARGLECGEIVIGPGEIVADSIQLKSIRRRATPNDLQKLADNKRRESEAFETCKQKIAEHGLPMKLISVEFMFDLNKIIFSFTSEGRVDFRNLVRDLAYVFRTRIELRQVGVRDETKLMGGIGNCGRPLCCASFLGDFVAVSIRMAKDQNLSLNPSKISGCCGRLMCCLQYEDENYRGGCMICGGEASINNINAEDDRAAAEKLEELELAEEKLEGVEAEKPVEVKPPARQNERRRPNVNRKGERSSERSAERNVDRHVERTHERSAERSGERRPSNRGSNRPNRASEGAGEQNKRPQQNKKPRPKKSAYQRDKNFHARRPNLDET